MAKQVANRQAFFRSPMVCDHGDLAHRTHKKGGKVPSQAKKNLFEEVFVVCRLRLLPLRFVTATFIMFAFVSSTARSQQAGVLLGYSELTSKGGDQYKTVWIVFSRDEVRVVAAVPDVIVPRSSGFWRVGRTIICEYDSSTEQDSSRDVLWQTAIENAPVIKQGPPCKSHQPGDVDDSADKREGPPSAGHHVALCRREDAKLLFVSPAYLAENFDDYDTCDPRGGRDTNRHDVRSLDGGAPISLADFFGERAAKEYSLAAKKGFAENSKDYNCPEPDPKRYDLKSWGIAHGRGTWRPVAAVDQSMGECAFGHPIDLPVPKNLTGEAPRGTLWPTISGAVPHLSDFYLSPLGDYALVLVEPKNAEYHLYAYAVQNGVPKKRLAEIPWDNLNSHPIVMAQWSSGKYVAAWTAAIQTIQDHLLTEPVVRPH